MNLNCDALQELYDTLVSAGVSMFSYADSPAYKAFKECDEKLSESATFKLIKDIQNRCDNLERSNSTLRGLNMESLSKKRQLEKDLDAAKKQRDYYKRISDDLQSRAHHAEDEVEDLKKELQDTKTILEKARKDLDFYFNKYQELKKDYETVMKERDDLSQKVVDLKARLNSFYATVTCAPEDYHKDGMYEVWRKLREVADATSSELLGCFTDVCELDDLVEWDLEDFMDEYKEWQEKKEKKYIDDMRKWLTDFCYERECEGCPLESSEYKCGCGYSFRVTDPSDIRIVPDEDIKRYYEKARGDGDAVFYFDNNPVKLDNGKLFDSKTMEGTRKAISKACENFCKAVRDADIKIKENWECTLEANVEINKDLLEKVCGVKPEEEEHQLEYGDAVRLPWRDYDYMYIGPEGKHIRLFDPKTHAVVLVSVTDNLTYQGCKIIICDEEDLRKIWKDKK